MRLIIAMTQTQTTDQSTIIFVRSAALNITPAVQRYVNTLKGSGYRGRMIGIEIEWDKLNGKRERVDVDDTYTLVGSKGTPFMKFITLVIWQLFQIRQLSKFKPTVLQYCDVFSVIPALFSKYLYGTKLIFDIRDNIGGLKENILTRILAAIERYAIKKSNAIVIVRDGRKVFLPRGVDDRVFVIPNTPLQDVQPLVGANVHATPIVINVSGYLGKWRNIKALCAAASSSTDIRLDVYGNIYGNRVMKLLEGAGIVNVNAISNDLSLERMGKSDVVAIMYDDRMLINRYADPNKYYEALMMGKPILCTKGMELAKEVECYCCGFAIEYGHPEQILEAVSIMKNRGGELSRNARKLFEEKYLNAFQSSARKLYESISLLIPMPGADTATDKNG